MNKTKVAIGLLILLLISPFIGIFIPWLHYFIPISIAFNMPIDGPPFSEALMPLIASLLILIGGIGFLLYLFSKGKKLFLLKAYAGIFIFYSGFALLIWLLFFSVRFFKHFPIKEIDFYVMWASAVVPHAVWISLLIWCIKIMKNSTKEGNLLTDNQTTTPDAHITARP